jgi:hypothetical protein
MLATPTTRQMNKLLAVLLALVTELVEDYFDVHFFQQSLRSILEFTDLKRQFLHFDCRFRVGRLVEV